MKRYKWECVACKNLNSIGEQFCTKCFHEYETACEISVDQGPLTKEELIEAVKELRSRVY